MTAPALASVVPRSPSASLSEATDLSQAENRAIDKLGYGRFFRRNGGWTAGSGVRISLETGKRLIARQLARVDTTGRNPQLVLTGAGLTVRAVILQRKRT